MISKSHHYFMLPLNPLPIIISASAFNTMLSLLLFFKYEDLSLLVLNLMFTSFSMLMWWNNYSKEFCLEGKSSLTLESGVKLSMVLFISSEVFFFFSFFWSYFHFFLSPSVEVGLTWPPCGVEMFDFSNVPLINTLVLMGSGLTVTISHNYMVNNKMKNSVLWLFFTIVLGMSFSYLQWDEYCSSFFSISDGTFGTSFFILTGFHGLHVIIGSLFLLYALIWSFSFSNSNKSFLSFELSSWYWHFVDVVWIFLYFFLYYLNF